VIRKRPKVTLSNKKEGNQRMQKEEEN